MADTLAYQPPYSSSRRQPSGDETPCEAISNAPGRPCKGANAKTYVIRAVIQVWIP